jgi:hypothetical protein
MMAQIYLGARHHNRGRGVQKRGGGVFAERPLAFSSETCIFLPEEN